MTEINKSKKIGMFLDDRTGAELSQAVQMSMLGENTGNQLFFYALKEQLYAASLARNTKVIEDLEEYDAFVTTDLVWIRENVDMSYLNKYLQLVGDKALVPISIGLQAMEYKKSFRIRPETVAVLKRLEERCVMGVRGDYTAEILDGYGIKNIQVIGCPSLYLLQEGFQRREKATVLQNVAVNFRSFGEKLTCKEKAFLLYAADKEMSFIEQTKHSLKREHVTERVVYEHLSGWLERQGKMFLNISEWRNYMKDMDFCMGSRFHGNVIALWEGTPALFLLTDSRTRELCEFFQLPCMEMEKFSVRRPITKYYRKANYEKFNKTFLQKKLRYEEFLQKNGLK